MNYPKIVDSNGNTLAVLNNVINPVVKEQINGEFTFSFTAIIEELKTDYIHYDNYVEVDDQLFQIAKYKELRTPDNKLLVNVLCEQVSYKLLDKEHELDNFIMEAATPMTALLVLLQDTPFTVGIVEVGGTADIRIEETTNRRAVLNEIANIFGGEYKFDRYTISLLVERGQNRGTEFRVGKNIQGISREVDATQKDESGNPKVTYEVEILELNEHEDFKGLEGFELGDTTKSIDTELKINVSARIFEIEYNPLLRKNTRTVLGNFVENIATENISIKRAANLVTNRSNIWDRAGVITPQGTIYTQILEGSIDVLQNKFNSSKSNWYTDDDGNMIFETLDKTSAMKLSGAGFELANEKDINGNYIFRTFGTGGGFTADELTTGKILASLIDAGTITFGMLDAVAQNQTDNTIANTYTDTKNTELETALTAVAQAKANLAEANAKAYADGVITDEEQARISDAEAKLKQAKDHADSVASTAETNANSYTNTTVSPVSNTANNALNTANTANTNASNAQSTANTANSTANTAKSTADSALATANNAAQKGVKFDNSIMIGNGNGVKVLDALNITRVILGQYAAGKYGLKVTEGEIYGTTIQSGAEGATTYAKIDTNGDFAAYKNGERIIFMQASAADGRFRLGDGQGNPYALSMLAVVDIGGVPYAKINAEKALYVGSEYTRLQFLQNRGINAYTNGGEFYVDGDYWVTGSKNAIVTTETQGSRLLYSYESPESKFFDEGVAKLENGISRIDIDPVFLETIEAHSICPYIIHLTAYDWLNLRIKEIGDSYFIVEEKEKLNGKFSWQLSAIRKGFAGVRLKRVDDEDVLTSNWEDDLLNV